MGPHPGFSPTAPQAALNRFLRILHPAASDAVLRGRLRLFLLSLRTGLQTRLLLIRRAAPLFSKAIQQSHNYQLKW